MYFTIFHKLLLTRYKLYQARERAKVGRILSFRGRSGVVMWKVSSHRKLL
jgi:hypothetical protein